MRKITAIILLLSVFIVNSASIRPSGFGEGGVRIIGMGEAAVCLQGDPNQVFFNPAGLAYKSDDREFSFMLKANDRNNTTYDSMAFFTNYETTKEEKKSLTLQDILNNPEDVSLTSEKKVYKYSLGFGVIFSEENNKTDMKQFVLGLANTLGKEKKLSIGLKLRHVTYSNFLDEQGKYVDFSETALGFGSIYKINDKVSVGLVVDNIIKDSPFDLPTIFTAGVGLNLTNDLIVLFDVYNFIDSKEEVGDIQFRAGLEKKFMNDNFRLRVGTKNGNLNLGFSFKLTDTFVLDYAYMADYDTDIQQHFVGASAKF